MDKKQRKKEFKIIFFLIIMLASLSGLQFKLLQHKISFEVSSSILIFLVINLNLILLLLLIFMILRNLVKLYYERKERVPGSKIKTRLLTAFIFITLVPNIMLFISSVNFINSSITYWFNAPVEQALKNSLEVGYNYFKYIEKTHKYFIRENLKNINSNSMDINQKQISGSPFDFIEVYNSKGRRIEIVKAPEIEETQEVPLTKINNIENFPVTITIDDTQNKLIKTIIKKDDLFISAGVFAKAEILHNFKKISEGYDEYQQIKLMKNAVKTTYILALFVVSFLVLFSAIWFAFYFAKTITDPLLKLVNATKDISKGDLDINLETRSNDEIGNLISAFNKMTLELKKTKASLQQQNEDAKSRTRYIETILRNISTGVIAIDSAGKITAANTALGNIFMTDASKLTGKCYKDELPDKYCDLAKKYIGTKTIITEQEMPLQLSIRNKPKNLILRFSSLHDEWGTNIGMVTACEDVTELEKAQRMAAWREVARQIAHEVKNPLTPISLAAQRLQRKFPDLSQNKIFVECTHTIIEHVGIMRSLVNEFATYARFPSPQKKLFDFKDVINATIPLYQEKYPDIEFTVNMDKNLPNVYMDKRQMNQAFINLVDNAAAAMNNKGFINIDIEYQKHKGSVNIKFSDSGPGVKKNKRSRLFEPYFSTKKSGTGLGLTIVNSIIGSHGGSIKLDDSDMGGACFIIDIPV